PAIQSKAMSSYRELLQTVTTEIEEADASGAQKLLEDGAVLVDVRERDEWEQGRIPGAVHVPRGNLESRIEQAAPDRSRPVVLYCAAGNRSAFAAKTLAELGYHRPVSLAGGYTDWQRNGLPTDLPRTLSPARQTRYSRHLLIPEVGEEGQLRLLDSRILLIGAGGLGSPAALYLAAAGIGTIGIVDDDTVDATNLQRQIVHSTERLGEPKAESAKRTSEALKLALGIGEPLVGRLLLVDALATSFTEVQLRRDPACPVCGESPTITEYVDYVEFCQGVGAHV